MYRIYISSKTFCYTDETKSTYNITYDINMILIYNLYDNLDRTVFATSVIPTNQNDSINDINTCDVVLEPLQMIFNFFVSDFNINSFQCSENINVIFSFGSILPEYVYYRFQQILDFYGLKSIPHRPCNACWFIIYDADAILEHIFILECILSPRIQHGKHVHV